MSKHRTWFKQHSEAENLTKAVANLMYQLDVPVTQNTLADTLRAHPRFPSLAAAADALRSWGIEVDGFRISSGLLDRIPLPCLSVLSDGHFVVLETITKDDVTYIDPAEGWISLPIEDFDSRWEGMILAVEPREQAGEADYATQRLEERRAAWRRHLLRWGGGALTLLGAGLTGWMLQDSPAVLGLLAAKTVGLLLCVFLVLHHFSSVNTFWQKLCPTRPRASCAGVLQSKAAYLFDWIPMADLGALYFAGGLVAVLVASLHGESLASTVWILGLLTVLALPYTLFSVYYQARVAKQWCWLCLAVQALLWVEFFLQRPRLLDGAPSLGVPPFATILFGFGLPAILWMALRPALLRAGQVDGWRYRYLRLLRTPGVVEQLLQDEAPIPMPNFQGELRLGAPEAPYAITMVTHPRCRLCAMAHREAMRLVEQYPEQVSVVIRFFCPEAEGLAKDLVRHVLALNIRGQHDQARVLLERWFAILPQENFWQEDHALPDIEAELKQADEVLAKAAAWAQSLHLRGTPAIYLNSRPLPPSIGLADLHSYLPSRSSLDI